MIKLKKEINVEKLEDFGFYKDGTNYIKTIGALDIFCDIKSKVITGVGFYPVGEGIVLRNIKDLRSASLIVVSGD